MAPQQNIATDFNKIINEGRERKKNEALANRIFGSKEERRQSVSSKANSSSSSSSASLASRVGVKKRIQPGKINGDRRRDQLHGIQSVPNLRNQIRAQDLDPNSLASRIHAPGTKAPIKAPNKAPVQPLAQNPPTAPRNACTAKLANALERSSSVPTGPRAQQPQQRNAHPAPAPAPAPVPVRGLAIRGLAGPYIVMAQNFAPGTTAADIESAMTPIGGLIMNCRILKTHPIVIAEIEFESREGADRVINTFNNQTADGRLLYVYLKPAGAGPSKSQSSRNPTRGAPAAATNNTVIMDGTMGFKDPMVLDTDDDVAGSSDRGDRGSGGRGGSGGSGGLYSDNLIQNNNKSSRRGRGFHHGQSRNGR